MTKLNLNVCNLMPPFALRAGVKVETPWFQQWPTVFSFLFLYPGAFQNVLRNSKYYRLFCVMDVPQTHTSSLKVLFLWTLIQSRLCSTQLYIKVESNCTEIFLYNISFIIGSCYNRRSS